MSEISALVQPKETNRRWSTPNTYQELLKREHAAEFRAAEFLYATIDEQEESEKSSLLSACRSSAWFIRNNLTGEVRIASNSCKLRHCPLCAKARQNYITGEVTAWFQKVKHPKLLTLTLRHTSSPLKAQVAFLYKCFQKFRKRKFVTHSMRGGVWFFQVKKSDKDGFWHPHIHALIDSDFMDRKAISSLWAEITVGSNVIDIRAVFDTEKAVKHNARYCATPCELEPLAPWERYELYDCFKGRRLVGCWGSAKDISLRATKPPDSENWINIGTWATVIALAGEDDRADAIINAWRKSEPLPAGNSLEPTEREIAGLPPPDERPLISQQYCFDFYTRA